MKSIFYPAASKDPRGLVVFLPGMGNGPEQYKRSGFVDIVRRINPAFDMIAADAHFGYFRNWQVTNRLHTDVIAPIADRYERVWVVGISIGGLVATTYAMEHGDLVEGVIALAPYLADREMLSEIKRAGSLSLWSPPDLSTIDSFERRHYYRLWSWLKRHSESQPNLPDLYLGVGQDDGLFRPNQLIAEYLPPEHYASRPGGHTWSIWTPLFDALAEKALSPLAFRIEKP